MANSRENRMNAGKTGLDGIFIPTNLPAKAAVGNIALDFRSRQAIP